MQISHQQITIICNGHYSAHRLGQVLLNQGCIQQPSPLNHFPGRETLQEAPNFLGTCSGPRDRQSQDLSGEAER
jgi:hypothetical protein